MGGWSVVLSKERAHQVEGASETLGEVEIRLSTTIRQFRLKRGMSQADLARALGVRNTAVSRWELMEAAVSADALLRLARVFEVPISALFGDQAVAVPTSPAERSRMLDFLKLAGSIQDHVSRSALLQISRVLSRHAGRARGATDLAEAPLADGASTLLCDAPTERRAAGSRRQASR